MHQHFDFILSAYSIIYAQCCDQTTPTNMKLLTMITITIYPQQYCNAKGSGRVVIVLEPSQLYQYMNEPIGQEMHVTYM